MIDDEEDYNEAFYARTTLLLGSKAMQRLQRARVIVFGVGGVGSWCAEALLRTGVGHLTLVDADTVAPTNTNRQLMATRHTLGQPKVEALRARLLDIFPSADVVALQQLYDEVSSASFALETYDCVVDAIDALRPKAHLIQTVTALTHRAHHPVLFSSMGAALRLDATKIAVSPFWEITGDGLAKALRTYFKKTGVFPACRFLCVHSHEPPQPNQGHDEAALHDASMTFHKASINGSLCHITATFGFMLSSLVINNLLKDVNETE